MDGPRFDALSRSFATTGATRRRLLRSIIAAGTGGLLFGRGGHGAAAQECASVLGQACQGDGECGSGQAGVCPTQLCCGVCVDVLFDQANCGSCGFACPSGTACDGGQCASACPPNSLDCGNGCVDLTLDPSNCGGCGVSCPDGTICDGGQCVSACSPTAILCGDICVDPSVDPSSCGGCGIVCPPDATCEQGICTCPAGLQICGECVDLASDPSHCGDCFAACGADQSCCGGICADLASDAANCGVCGAACPPDEQCQGGACESTCPDGTSVCGDRCVDLQTDPTNCGACDQSCGDGRCANGICVGNASCVVEQLNSELTYRFATRSDDDFAIEITRAVRVDQAGLDIAVTSQTVVTRAGALVLEIAAERETAASGVWSTTLRYGQGFEGIQRAEFTGRADGPIRGTIDGRDLAPFESGAEPGTLTFGDGAALPATRVDDEIVQGIARIFEQANAEAEACSQPVTVVDTFTALGITPATAVGGMSKSAMALPSLEGYCEPGHITYPPLGSAGCLRCRGLCVSAGVSCGVAAGVGCGAGCTLALVGYAVCFGVCFVPLIVGCLAAEVACLANCRKPPGGCCPSGCADGCCDTGEICLDQGSGLCCDGDRTPCGGACCCQKTDTCMNDGTCCPRGSKICNGTCCNPGETCFGGGCCAKVCDQVTPATCCDAFSACTECGCCPPGSTCSETRDRRKVCCPNGQLCGPTCCPNGEICGDPSTGVCIPPPTCPAGQISCSATLCCPKFQGSGPEWTSCCGTICCPTESPYCCSPGDETSDPVCRSAGCIR